MCERIRMKPKLIVVASAAVLLLGLTEAVALTFEEIAGRYEGWRTETSATGTIHYQETDEILPDGTFTTWLVDQEHGIVYTMTSVLTLDENGNIAGVYSGILDINGPQLQIKARDGRYSVHAVTHRTD